MRNSMTRKHFIALAEALRLVRPCGVEQIEGHIGTRRIQWENDRARIITVCEQFNSGFERSRFIDWTEK